jgi:2-iminobutanoate/2-iminopropanoate deaminase
VEFLSLNQGSARANVTSDIVLTEGWAIIAGQLPIDLRDDRVALPDGIEGQTKKILANLEILLAEAGLRREDVVSVRVSLVDFPRLYERMNAAYAGFWPPDRLPARSAVGATALPRGALVAMDFTVQRPGVA